MIKTKTNISNIKDGFTLLELVIVTAIISIIYTTVITVVNPVQKITKTYDSQRLTDINTINKAVQQYFIDKKDYRELNISTIEKEICDTKYVGTKDNVSICSDKFVNLSVLVPDYIIGVPTDPLNLINQPKNNPVKIGGNGYTIKIDRNNRVVTKSINLTTNNTPTSIFNNLKIIDSRRQITMLITVILIITVIAIFLIVKRYKKDKN